MCERLGSPMYAALLDRLASDADEGGATAALLAGWRDAAVDDAVPLRLMGALHRLVLDRRAPGLALHYPSVGGTFSGVDAAWPDLHGVLVDRGTSCGGHGEQRPADERGRPGGGARRAACATSSAQWGRPAYASSSSARAAG